MMRIELSALRWKIKIRYFFARLRMSEAVSKVEEVWSRPWFGYFLVGVAFILAVYWSFQLPPSNYAVITMAVVAGLMGMRPEMRGRERWFWAVILTLLASIEIRAVNNDRKRQNIAFEAIGRGIKTAIKQSADQFEVTMRRFDNVSATLSVVTVLLQGSNRPNLSSSERQKIAMETVEYIKKGESANLSSFSRPSLSIMANELADQTDRIWREWYDKDRLLGEHYAIALSEPLAATKEEIEQVKEEWKTKRNGLRVGLDTEWKRLLSDGYFVCKEILKRTTTTVADQDSLARFQNAIKEVPDLSAEPDYGLPLKYASYLRVLAKRVSP